MQHPRLSQVFAFKFPLLESKAGSRQMVRWQTKRHKITPNIAEWTLAKSIIAQEFPNCPEKKTCLRACTQKLKSGLYIMATHASSNGRGSNVSPLFLTFMAKQILSTSGQTADHTLEPLTIHKKSINITYHHHNQWPMFPYSIHLPSIFHPYSTHIPPLPVLQVAIVEGLDLQSRLVGGTQRTLGLLHLTAELLDGTLVLGHGSWVVAARTDIYIYIHIYIYI